MSGCYCRQGKNTFARISAVMMAIRYDNRGYAFTIERRAVQSNYRCVGQREFCDFHLPGYADPSVFAETDQSLPCASVRDDAVIRSSVNHFAIAHATNSDSHHMGKQIRALLVRVA